MTTHIPAFAAAAAIAVLLFGPAAFPANDAAPDDPGVKLPLTFVVTEPGAGYNTPPVVTVDGMKGVRLEAKLALGKDLKTNGGVAEVKVAAPQH